MIQDPLSSLAESLVGSEIVKLGNAINERKAKGEKIYNYTIGDFNPEFFPIPQAYQDAIIAAYKAHRTNYPPADGILELRQAVGDLFRRHQNIDYKNDEILISSGGRPIIYALFRTLIDPGDKVIYTVPSWNNNHYTHICGGTHCVVPVYPEDQFMPKASQIEAQLSGARLICLCSPQNPTGTTLDKNELLNLCNSIVAENKKRAPHEKKLYLMYDQMYWTLTYGEIEAFSPVQLCPEMKAYTIFVDGVSKAFAATGVRVGWTMGPAPIVAKMKALLSHVGAWAPMAEQHATAQFLQNNDAVEQYLKDFKHHIEDRLYFIFNHFIALQKKGYPIEVITPQAAIYLTVKLDFVGYTFKGKTLQKQEDVSEFLLNEAHLALVPFSCFGADSNAPWYRISVGTCSFDDLKEMFESLEQALAQLQKN